jgi:hypothetical protein
MQFGAFILQNMYFWSLEETGKVQEVRVVQVTLLIEVNIDRGIRLNIPSKIHVAFASFNRLG